MGAGYSEDEIKEVLVGKAEHRPRQKQPPKEQPFQLLVDIQAKFKAFGYDVIDVADGNDMQQVLDALHAPACPGKPRLIHLHTLKGKGVSFMEGQVGWHGKAPNAEQTAQALSELEG